MPLVIPAGYAQVIHSLRWAGDPDLMAVTYGVDIDSPSFAGTADDIADEVSAAFIAEVMPVVNQIIELVQTEVRWQNLALPNPPQLGINSDTDTGSDSNLTVLPQNSAFLVHKRGPIGGRGGRGRMYFPAVPEAGVDNLGNIGGATLTAWNTALDDFLTALEATSSVVTMVVLHNDPGAFSAATPAVVSSLTLDPQLSTQRRRLRH